MKMIRVSLHGIGQIWSAREASLVVGGEPQSSYCKLDVLFVLTLGGAWYARMVEYASLSIESFQLAPGGAEPWEAGVVLLHHYSPRFIL